MKLKQPFHKVYQNVLITTENEVWAYFTCPSEYVIGQNKEVQEKHKRKWSQFLQSLRRFEDFELFLNPHSYNLNERLSAFSKSFDEQAQDMGNALIDRTLSELESQLRVITTEKFYIGVKLSSLSSATSLKGKIMELVDYYAGKLLAITQYHMTIDEDFLARYRIIEAEVFQLVGAINGRRLTEKEVLQVCRYPYVRGMNTSFD
ncbi:ATPase, partial [Bacteroides fragilis]